MNLLFVYIKNYRNLKNIGVSFNPDRVFRYDHISKKLEFDVKKVSINGFFGDNIENVTAVVGANGVGKSNLLEFLIDNLSNFKDGGGVRWHDGESNKGIFVFNNNIFHHEELAISNEVELREKGFEIEPFPEFLGFNSTAKSKLREIGYIYYSNIFDSREIYPAMNLENISTNYLLSYGYNDIRYLNIHNQFNNGGSESVDNLTIFNANETLRHISLLQSNIYELPFLTPSSATLIADDPQLSNIFQTSGNSTIHPLITKLSRLYSDLMNVFRDNTIPKANKIRSTFAHNLLYILVTNNIDAFSNFKYEELFTIVLEGVIDARVEILEITEVKEFNSFFEKLNSFLDGLTQGESEDKGSVNFQLVWEEFNLFNLKFDSETRKNEFFELILLHSHIAKNRPVLSVYWSGLSSGQKSMLSLFARFFGLLESQKLEETQNLNILIDEGEVYYHPQWQKKYFSSLTDFLCRIFPDKKIQLFITSNSPFLVSDLPKSNIIFLKKGLKEQTEIDDSDFKDETFGGNIHALLSNAFFLENGLIGDFARSKINEVINLLLSDELKVLNKTYIKSIIDIVGEPIIKEKLLQLWNEKFGVEEEILFLEERLKILKNHKVVKNK